MVDPTRLSAEDYTAWIDLDYPTHPALLVTTRIITSSWMCLVPNILHFPLPPRLGEGRVDPRGIYKLLLIIGTDPLFDSWDVTKKSKQTS